MSLSATATAAANAPQTSEVFLACLTLGDPASPDLRIVNNNEDITKGGATFTAYPFNLQLPADTDDKPAKGTLNIDNADRTLVPILRSLQAPLRARIEIVLASDPDTVEVGPRDFLIKHFSFNVQKIAATLESETPISAPFPAEQMGPTGFPGLYQ